MPETYIKRILEARVYDVAIETPLELMPSLSKRVCNQVLLKREDLQSVFSFKLRGAYNKIVNLSAEEKERGVICASAGNHAQGVALSAQKQNIKALIIMPCTTPEIKVKSVRSYGAKIILKGDTFDEAQKHALEISERDGLIFVHPYDDPLVIAGQGTIAMEIFRQYTKPIHSIFVPVGGGGLIAGIAAYVKYLRPEIKVVGVEYDSSASLHAALQKGHRAILPTVGIFADGVAVSQIGKETYRIAKQCVDEVIVVKTDEICAAIKDIFDDTRSIAEPAGALALAGLKKYVEREQLQDQTMLAINSGANINFDRLRHISERTEISEKREAIFAVTIDEKPGSFRRFCKALGKRNITEFNYRYADPAQARIFVGVQLSGDVDEKCQFLNSLSDKGYPVEDLSDNEMAKLHVRYLVGGCSQGAGDEVFFRFEFPERPGALLGFLSALGTQWNISLFHYRNHGSAYGRVLMGLQMMPAEKKHFIAFLKKTDFRFWDESSNPANQFFR